MGQYKTKLLVVEAEKFHGIPSDRYPEGLCLCNWIFDDIQSEHAHVHTKYGVVKASISDYIVKADDGFHVIPSLFFERFLEKS